MQRRIIFAVPVGAGGYAPEILYLNVDNAAKSLMDIVLELRFAIENLIATAVVEVDILRVGGDPTVAGDWILNVQNKNTAGLADLLALAGWQGVRIRAKSGGTAGNMAVSAAWS